METKPLSPEKIAQIKDLLKDIDINSTNPSMIQDNKSIFSFKDNFYRATMPNQMEQTLAEQAQNKIKIKLIQEKGNIGRKQLIKNLKENLNIDIVELEKDKEKLRIELQDLYLDLAIVNSDEVEKIEELREKKNNIESKFMEITIEIIEHLIPSIEEQIKALYYKYLAYLCTERQINEGIFERVWKSYDDFGKDRTGLTYKAIENIQTLLLSIKE